MNTLELKGNKEPDEQKTPVEISGSQAVLDAMISEGRYYFRLSRRRNYANL